MDWFIKTRIAFFDIIQQLLCLQVLAAETENGDAGHVRMISISRQQFSQYTGILACAAATTLVIEEFDTIHVFENTIGMHNSLPQVQVRFTEVFTAFIQLKKLMRLQFIFIRYGIT